MDIMKPSASSIIESYINSLTANKGTDIHIIEMVLPMYVLFLIPTIIIEWYVVKHYLPSISLCKTFWPITAANLVSTLLGTPISLGIIQILAAGGIINLPSISEIWSLVISIVQAPWHLYENGEALTLVFHLIPTLLSIGLFYFMSVWIEGLVLTKFFKISTNKGLIKEICWKMNLVSYGCFFALGLTALAFVTKGFGLL